MRLLQRSESKAEIYARLDGLHRVDSVIIEGAKRRERDTWRQYMAFVRAGVTGETVHILGRPVKVRLEWEGGCPFTTEQLVKLFDSYAAH